MQPCHGCIVVLQAEPDMAGLFTLPCSCLRPNSCPWYLARWHGIIPIGPDREHGE